MGYELTSDLMAVTIADLGAHLASVVLRLEDNEELQINVGYPPGATDGTGYHGASVGRYANRIAGSRFGRVLRAAKENPERTEIMGFSVFRFRLIAYVIAGMIAGVSGLLLAQQAEFISPAISTWQKSGELIIVVVLGGMGTRNGAVLGAIFFVLVEEFLGGLLHEWKLIFGPLLVLMVLYSRGGISDLLSARPQKALGP